jgi:hypothetical protein
VGLVVEALEVAAQVGIGEFLKFSIWHQIRNVKDDSFFKLILSSVVNNY